MDADFDQVQLKIYPKKIGLLFKTINFVYPLFFKGDNTFKLNLKLTMANTYHQMYVQTVFAVKHRDCLIQKEWRQELMGVIGNLINETGCKNIIVNGVANHVHCFFGLIPTLTVSDIMQGVKSKSSKWVNEKGFIKHRFEWQAGFGSFTYSKSHIHRVYQYILNQERHHQKKTFLEEYEGMLRKYEIIYDPKYLFKDVI